MDFLYADLNEVVDPFIYKAKQGNGTIDLNIDNKHRTIEANVIKTPKKLSLLVDGVLHDFDGSQDSSIEIKHREYILKKVSGGDGDTRATYSLLIKDHTTNEFTMVEGSDLLYIEDSASILNIENGSTTGQTSTKIGVGFSGLTSVNYKKDDSSYLYIGSDGGPTNVANDDGDYIAGTRAGQTLYGGFSTGVQSIALGGQAYGLSHQNTIVVTQIDIVTKEVVYRKIFNVIQQDPIVVLIDSSYPIIDSIHRVSEIGNSITVEMKDSLQVPLIVERRRGQFNRIYPTTAYDSYISVQQIRNVTGVSDMPTANGHQAMSMGGSTHADANWSQSFGLGTRAQQNCQMVIGKFNSQEDNAAFVVGNGHYDTTLGDISRSNAFSIMFDGSVKVFDEDSPNKYRVGKIAFKEEIEEAIVSSITEMQEMINGLAQQMQQTQTTIDGIKNDLKSIGYTAEDDNEDGQAEFELDDGVLT